MRPGHTAGHVEKSPRGRGWPPYAALLSAVVVAVMLAACGTPDGDVPSARDTTLTELRDVPQVEPDAQTNPPDAAAAGYLAEARFADADFERGELLSFACIVCHTLEPGEGHMIGPNLGGIFGRPAASAPDYPYSDALREAGIVWSPAELDAWLARPDEFVPGNLMVFAGIYSVSDRTDLLAFLLRETAAEEFTATQ